MDTCAYGNEPAERKGCFRRKVEMTGEGIDRLVVRRKPREHVPHILSICKEVGKDEIE